MTRHSESDSGTYVRAASAGQYFYSPRPSNFFSTGNEISAWSCRQVTYSCVTTGLLFLHPKRWAKFQLLLWSACMLTKLTPMYTGNWIYGAWSLLRRTMAMLRQDSISIEAPETDTNLNPWFFWKKRKPRPLSAFFYIEKYNIFYARPQTASAVLGMRRM